MTSLTEIIREAERLRAAQHSAMFPDYKIDEEIAATKRLEDFWRQHGPRLLAVAKAAVDMRKALGWLEGVHEYQVRDHACVVCVPHGYSIVPGFLCGRHAFDATAGDPE